VKQFTFVPHGANYAFGVGDFSDPVTGAAGTLFFEPGGAIFLLFCRAALADLAATEVKATQ
jgi:hypothetical protein